MANWAELDSKNKVIRVFVGDNNDSNGDEGYQWLIDNLGGTWIKTSFNTRANKHQFDGIPLGKNYAGIGYSWDGIGFAAPQPFPSWTLDQETYIWKPPTPMPIDEKRYQWDESTKSWIEVPE